MTDFLSQESEQVQFIEPSELKQWLAQADSPDLIDVRDSEAYQNFNIGGENIPLTEFSSSVNRLDPDQPVVIVCQLGQKSFNAASLLIMADFSSVYSLKGGLEAWNRIW